MEQREKMAHLTKKLAEQRHCREAATSCHEAISSLLTWATRILFGTRNIADAVGI